MRYCLKNSFGSLSYKKRNKEVIRMPIHGLTAAEVESRRAAGLTNCPPRSPTKTTGEIVRDNICT